MLGLYIHIPFCSKKCYYCDFASYENLDHLVDSYIDSLLKELNMYSNEKFDTVFIGGGTPSYLNESQLEKLLKGIEKNLKNSNIVEYTIECNPGTLNYNKLNIMKHYGVDRLSIGLQSANNETLKFIGRVHLFEDYEKNLNYALDVGFKNINTDLIFGISNETFEDYKNTLNIVSKYNLTHISAYNLILEENTKFYTMYKQNKFRELDEDLQLEMYKYTKQFLESKGYYQYEVSNYAKKGKECLQNLIYWNFDDYVGVGVGAHSFYKGVRFSNVRKVDEYIKMLENNNHKYIEKHINSLEDNISEFVMVGFRKNMGISVLDFKERFNEDFFQFFKIQIDKYRKKGLIDFKEDRVFLTSEGFVLMNYVLEEFIL